MAFKLEALEKHKDFTMWMRTEKTQGVGSLQQLCSYSPSDLHPSGQQANVIDAETIGWGTDEARRGGALQQLFCHSPRSLSRVSTQLEASGQLCPWQSPHVCLRNKLVISFPHTLLAVFFFLTKYVRFSWRAQTAVVLWKSLRKLGMVCSLKAGGNYLLKPSEPRGCVVGRFSIIAAICLVALELRFFNFFLWSGYT